MNANEDSKSAWDGYRWREKMANAGYVVLAVTGLLALFAPSVGKHIHAAFFLGAALTFPMAMWRCPACRKTFFFAWIRRSLNPWRTSCVHCALRKWQEPPLSDEEVAKRRVSAMKDATRPALRIRQGDRE